MSDPPPEDNPYAAPASPAGPAAEPGGGTGGRGWVVWWSVVYAANLVLPLLFGWGLTARGGRVGMAAGILLLFALGLMAGRAGRGARGVMLVGGGVVGLAQFVPMLHLLAGIVAMEVTARLTGAPRGEDVPVIEPMNEAQGLLVTLLTGGMLMLAAAAIGLVLWGTTFALGRRGEREH